MKQNWTIFLSLTFTAHCMSTAMSANFHAFRSNQGGQVTTWGCSQHWARYFPFHQAVTRYWKKFTLRKQQQVLIWELIAANTFVSKAVLPGFWCNHTSALIQWPLDFGHILSYAVLWELRPTLFRTPPRSISEISHFTKSAIYHLQKPGSVSPCQDQGQIFWVIGCCLCNLTAARAAGDERWGDEKPSWKRMPDTSDSISEAIRCVSNSLPIFKQHMHSKTNQHALFKRCYLPGCVMQSLKL